MSMLTVEECELLTDSKYRSYITQVEKALRSFEYTSEWADLISALGKLNKVLIFQELKQTVKDQKFIIFLIDFLCTVPDIIEWKLNLLY